MVTTLPGSQTPSFAPAIAGKRIRKRCQARPRASGQLLRAHRNTVQQKKVLRARQPPTSVNPLCQVVAALERRRHLLGRHALVLGHVLGVLPLEELDAVLGVWLTAKVPM